jgi:anti-anti-sigma factor
VGIEDGDLMGVADGAGKARFPASQQAPFQIEASRDGRRVTAWLSGELDGRTTNPLHHLVWMLREDGAAEVILDLSGLDFIDKNGLREFLLLRGRSNADGFALRFVGVSDQIRSRFRMRGLDTVFALAA